MRGTARPDRVTRRKVVAAAVELMAVSGYRATALADVAAALGVSRQAIYHHFPDKPAILSAIFHSLFDRLVEAAERIARIEPGKSRFQALLSSHLDIVLSDRPRAIVAIEAHRDLPAADRAPVEEIRARYLSNLRAAYADGIAAGTLRDLPPVFAVRLVIGTANWAARWYRPQGPVAAEAMRADLQRFLLHGAGSQLLPEPVARRSGSSAIMPLHSSKDSTPRPEDTFTVNRKQGLTWHAELS